MILNKFTRYKAFFENGCLNIAKYKYAHMTWNETNERFCITKDLKVIGTPFKLNGMAPVDKDVFDLFSVINREIYEILNRNKHLFDNFVKFLIYEKPDKPRCGKTISPDYCIIQSYNNPKYEEIIGVFRIFYIQDNTFVEKARFAINRNTGNSFNIKDILEDEDGDNDELSRIVRQGHENLFYFIKLQTLLFAENELIENTRMRYFKEYVDIAKTHKREIFPLFLMLNISLYEKIFKSNYENVKTLVKERLNNFDTPRETIDRIFGCPCCNERELYKCLNVPSYALKMFDDALGEKTTPLYFYGYTLMVFKKIFNNEKLFFNMDQKNFKKIMYIIGKKRIFARRDVQIYFAKIMRYLFDLYGTQNYMQFFMYVFEFISKTVEPEYQKKSSIHYDLYPALHRNPYPTSRNESNLWIMYEDYLKILKEYNIDGQWKFKTIEQVHTEHDRVVNIINEMKTHAREEEFNKIKDSLQKYSYNGNEFCVCPPANAQEIVDEGKKLHHCVASYVNDVCMGNTVILFIRKKEDLKTPFFTLEVKDGAVRQCHGQNNRNINTEKGIKEFLEKYCKEKKISFSEDNSNNVLACG